MSLSKLEIEITENRIWNAETLKREDNSLSEQKFWKETKSKKKKKVVNIVARFETVVEPWESSGDPTPWLLSISCIVRRGGKFCVGRSAYATKRVTRTYLRSISHTFARFAAAFLGYCLLTVGWLISSDRFVSSNEKQIITAR